MWFAVDGFALAHPSATIIMRWFGDLPAVTGNVRPSKARPEKRMTRTAEPGEGIREHFY